MNSACSLTLCTTRDTLFLRANSRNTSILKASIVTPTPSRCLLPDCEGNSGRQRLKPFEAWATAWELDNDGATLAAIQAFLGCFDRGSGNTHAGPSGVSASDPVLSRCLSD